MKTSRSLVPALLLLPACAARADLRGGLSPYGRFDGTRSLAVVVHFAEGSSGSEAVSWEILPNSLP